MTSNDTEGNSEDTGAKGRGSLDAAGGWGPLWLRVVWGPVVPQCVRARAASESGPDSALTLSSWATWAFCRYMEYSTAVTIELVPNRMT